MTAAPLNNALAKVRARLPVKIVRSMIIDKKGDVFCVVPKASSGDGRAVAELIRDAMNEME